MKIVLSTVGTRGDVQPLVALGAEMKRRGHEPVVCAPHDFGSFVEEFGLTFRPICSDFRPFLKVVGGYRMLRRISREIRSMFETLEDATRTADAIVHSMMDAAGPSLAERRGVPLFTALYSPTFLRSPSQLPVLGQLGRSPARAWQCRLGWKLTNWLWNKSFGREINGERSRLGLKPISDVHRYLFQSGHVLLAADPALAPVPRSTDTTLSLTSTGFWFLDSEGILPETVEAFLASGEEPLLFGLGSMLSRRPAAITRLVTDTAQRLKRRLIIQAGWAGLEHACPNANVLVVQDAPHGALLPRVAAFIHHGGSGTFASAVRAGVPQVVIPHLGDQPFWGQRVRALGLGPGPLFWPLLTRRKLAEAVESALRCRPAAAAQGRRMLPNGVGLAADLIEDTTRG